MGTEGLGCQGRVCSTPQHECRWQSSSYYKDLVWIYIEVLPRSLSFSLQQLLLTRSQRFTDLLPAGLETSGSKA